MFLEIYPSIVDKNVSEGFHVLLQHSSEVTNGWFIILMLMAIWFITAVGYWSVKKDMQGSAATAGFITFIVALLLRLGDVISSNILITTIAVMVLGVVLLFFPRGK